MPKPKSKRNAKRSSRRSWTPLSGHKQRGGQLLPPITQLGEKLQITSWMDDRLPEMIWAGLIITTLGRERALSQFKEIFKFIQAHDQREQLDDLSLSGIAQIEQPLREELIGFIAGLPIVGSALSALLMFDGLPSRTDWERHLPPEEPPVRSLMVTVAEMLYHQTTTSTDCRWLRIMGMLASGKLSFDPDLRNVPEGWLKYPADFDEVLGSVRTMEQSLSHPPGKAADLTWPNAFWSESFENTPCMLTLDQTADSSDHEPVTRQGLRSVVDQLEQHWRRTHTTTRVDPKHDAVFGMAFYCLRILNDSLGIGISKSILGRLGLRTILETRVNLSYLLKQDDPALWETWRRYGAGQAKLNLLKFEDSVEPPSYIDVDTLDHIASEDIWQEFVTVNLGSWNKMDLRKTSERAGVKDVYDQHYPWTSSYSHAMWGAIRESSYQTCANPLHRLHRYPSMQPLDDCLQDAAELVDEILELLDREYPTFSQRLVDNAQ